MKDWIIYSVTQCGVSVMSIQFLLKQAGGPAAGRGSLSVTQSCEILREYPHSAFSASPCSFPIHVCQSFRQDSLNRVRRLQIKSRVATRQILDRETRRIPQSQWEWRDACVQTRLWVKCSSIGGNNNNIRLERERIVVRPERRMVVRVHSIFASSTFQYSRSHLPYWLMAVYG